MKQMIYTIYRKLQKYELILIFITKLQEYHITTILGDLVNLPSDIKYNWNPQRYCAKARSFYSEHKERIKSVCDMLCDDKSRKHYLAAIRYRTERRLVKRGEWSLTDQYFPKDIVTIRPDEVFIDGGAYNGDSINKLFKLASKSGIGEDIRVIAFEPSELNRRLLKRRYKNDKRVTIKDCGLSDSDHELYFYETGSVSYITDEEHANCKIRVTNIDANPECRDATWIKMDIENAEWDALHGAEKTIRRNRPTLTICIYHSDEDMYRIAEWIHEIVPEYRLYVRHHTRRSNEIVLYAVI